MKYIWQMTDEIPGLNPTPKTPTIASFLCQLFFWNVLESSSFSLILERNVPESIDGTFSNIPQQITERSRMY